jgi:hypothetical protein
MFILRGWSSKWFLWWWWWWWWWCCYCDCVNVSSSQVELDGLVTSSLAHRYQNVFDAYFNVIATGFLSLL